MAAIGLGLPTSGFVSGGGTATASAGMSAGAIAGGAMIGLSAVQSYFGGKAAESEFKIQQYKYEVDSATAKMNSNNVALQLSRQFNNTMASDAVMSAAQGRTGATVAAVGTAAEAQYNWDRQFASLSKDIQAKGLDSMAVSSQKAAELSGDSAFAQAVGSGLLGTAKLYSIGG